MENRIKKDLRPAEYLKDKLKLYIEAFISYYGEEYREYIENKLNNIFIVAYQRDCDLSQKLKDLEKKLGQNVVRKLFKKYYDGIEYNENLKNELINKYRKEYAKRVKLSLPKEYHELVEKYIESNDSLFVFGLKNNCNEFSAILGDIDTTTYYEYFTEEMDEKLNNPEVDDFEKEIIIENRIRYFKTIGIDKGYDYSNYINLEEYPSPEMVSEILKAKQQVEDLFNLELNSKTYPNCLFIEKEKEMGLLVDSSEEFSLMRIREEHNCVHTNIRINNGKMELLPEVFIYTGVDSLQRDNIIIHELNHVVEMALIELLENKVTIRSGWDTNTEIIGEKKDHIEHEHKPRKYERFNEVINELLAIDIHEKFKNMCKGVFSNKYSEDNLSSGYLNHEYIVKEFFETYKKEIIESRLTGNMQVLFDAVGEENFEALNALVNEDYQARDASAKETLHEDIGKRSNSILKQMSLHTMMRSSVNDTKQINDSLNL